MQDTSNSPVSILASFFSKSNTQPELCLITGSIGAGKTSWCLELAYQARLAGLSPRGLVSPAVFEMDEKIGIDLIDIESQQRSRLATLKKQGSLSPPGCEDIETTEWRFEPGVLEWANAILENSYGSQLLIIDELGPLEFSRRAGFQAGMALIDSRDYQHAFVVIRPVLLQAAQERWPWSETLDVTNVGMKPRKAAS